MKTTSRAPQPQHLFAEDLGLGREGLKDFGLVLRHGYFPSPTRRPRQSSVGGRPSDRSTILANRPAERANPRSISSIPASLLTPCRTGIHNASEVGSDRSPNRILRSFEVDRFDWSNRRIDP